MSTISADVIDVGAGPVGLVADARPPIDDRMHRCDKRDFR
jgi:hypothetical protein